MAAGEADDDPEFGGCVEGTKSGWRVGCDVAISAGEGVA